MGRPFTVTEQNPILRKALQVRPTVITVAVDNIVADGVTMVNLCDEGMSYVMYPKLLTWQQHPEHSSILAAGVQARRAPAPSSATMLASIMLSSLAALLFVYVFMPALWLSIMAVDDSLDAHEAGLAVVASRMLFFRSLGAHISNFPRAHR
jgi:hypothetical protein